MRLDSLKQERLKEVLEYSPDSGKFVWRIKRPNSFIGAEAGYIQTSGYRAITVDNVKYPAQRLVWLYVYGRFPEPGKVIDHINWDKQDNRLSNLREVPHQVNQYNRANTKGYFWDSERELWGAQIKINYKAVHLGRFKTKQEALDAYERAKARATEDSLNRQ